MSRAAILGRLATRPGRRLLPDREPGPLTLLRALFTLGIVMVSMTAAADPRERRDGALISRAECRPKTLDYGQWLENQEAEHEAESRAAREHGVTPVRFTTVRSNLQSEEEFRRRRAYEGFACEKLIYASDGLKVVAYLWRPADVEGKHLPLIIFNRGGGQDLGKLVPWEHDGFYDYLKSGFVVLATQYRGNDGGEGHDEEGGAEVADVVNLLPLARELGYVDERNVFMIGDSRGAMMGYLAMRRGLRVNAMAVVGSETDLVANLKRRPELEEGYAKAIPGFVGRRTKVLRDRSALFWADAISAPLLIMHGGKDWRVPPTQDLAFAARLQALRKPYELVVFDGGVHLLTFHWRERDQRTIRWFESHMAPQPATKGR